MLSLRSIEENAVKNEPVSGWSTSMMELLSTATLDSRISVFPEYLCQKALQGRRIQLLKVFLMLVTNEIWWACRKVGRHDARIKELRKLL